MPIERSSLTECWVGLVLSSPALGDEGQQRQVDVDGVTARQFIAELADRLEERQALDVADRAADLAQDEIVVRRCPSRMKSLMALVTCGTTWMVAPR